MANENQFLLHALIMGAYITSVYDILRILRRVIPHGTLLVSMEDICFWIYCAVKVFLLMYRESNGTLRWFAVLGAMTGMFLYRWFVSPYFVKYVSLALQGLFGGLAKILKILTSPLRRFFGRLREKILRAAKRYAVRRQKNRELGRRGFKNKLTFLRKLFKIKL